MPDITHDSGVKPSMTLPFRTILLAAGVSLILWYAIIRLALVLWQIATEVLT